MAGFKIITQVRDFTGKTALVRIDTDVDIQNKKILDDMRLKACLDTLNYLLRKGASIILLGHLGRPEPISSEFTIQNSEFSLEPVAFWFGKYYQRGILRTKVGMFDGWQITPKLTLLENLRFYPEEEHPDSNSGKKFVKHLSELGDIYINDAFAVAHRAHASISGIPKILPSYAGIHFAKEIEILTDAVNDPKRPLAVVIGGAKIETKLPLVEKMHKVADYVLVGGEIAEQDKILIRVQHEKIKGAKSAVLVADLAEDGLDITEKDAESFAQILNLSKTIVWNGPMGLTGKGAKTERGTQIVATAIANSSAYTIVGGGDTLSYLSRISLLDKFSFASTGGGAMLEFLSGKKLPGVAALEKNENYKSNGGSWRRLRV